MPKLVTLTANTGIDLLMEVDSPDMGGVTRAREAREFPAGKAVSVARAARALGLSSVLLGFVGLLRALPVQETLALALLPAAARAGSVEQVIPAGGNLAAAVAAAPAGATLVVDGGVHRGQLRLERKICLMGRAGAVLDGGGVGTVVRIAAAGVELRGLAIQGTGESLMAEDAGVRIEKAAGVRLAQLELRDCLYGIFATGCEKLQVDGCRFVGKELPDVRRGDAVHAWGCNHARFTGNRIERGRDVVLWYSTGTTFDDNVVAHGRYGLHYMYSDQNSFRRNRFESNQVGAVLMYGRGLEGEGNTFLRAQGVGSCGLLVKDADDIALTGNRLVANATGLLLDGAPLSPRGQVRIAGNLIARNDVGLEVSSESKGIVFIGNSFSGNRVQVQVLGSGPAGDNVWAEDGRGNFWSDAVPYDRDGDGVSEIPYRLESTFESLAGRNPSLSFFEASPACEALDQAARLFPILAPELRLVDPKPLVRPALGALAPEPVEPGRRGGLALAGLAMLAASAAMAAAARMALA